MSPSRGIAVCFALLLALAGCAGTASGTPAATQPSQSEDVDASAAPSTEPSSEPVPDSSIAPQPTASTADLGIDRPATINLDISGTPDSNGSYTSSGPARLCGDAQINLTGNIRAFNFEFPHDGDFEIVDVTFSADDLVAGSSTSSFHLDVTVHAKSGGEPPATVVDTSNAGNSGSAQLSDSGGTTTLTVTGSDDIGQTLHMVATCGPKG